MNIKRSLIFAAKNKFRVNQTLLFGDFIKACDPCRIEPNFKRMLSSGGFIFLQDKINGAFAFLNAALAMPRNVPIKGDFWICRREFLSIKKGIKFYAIQYILANADIHRYKSLTVSKEESLCKGGVAYGILSNHIPRFPEPRRYTFIIAERAGPCLVGAQNFKKWLRRFSRRVLFSINRDICRPCGKHSSTALIVYA